MYWIGGGFCRHLFFFSLTMALCALDRKRYLWAGLAFGCAIAFRVFPMVFLFGACLPFLARLDRDWSKEYASVFKLAGGAFVSLGALVVISLCVYPATHWLDFFTKIALHGKTFFVMHLGYDKLAAYSYNTGPQYFDFNGISSFENWNIVLNDRFNEHWMFHRGVALLFTAGAVFASFRMEPKMASLIVGETILFFYALPANYYYIYLATFGVVVVTALKETALRGNSLRFWSLMGFVVFINLVGGFTGDAIVLNWWINLALFCLLFIYIISQLWHRPFDWREHKHQVFITLAIIACLALITFRPRVMPSTNTNGLKTQVLLFADKDVASGEWWMQDDHEYNPHMWPTKSQLVVKNTKGPVSVSKHFMIPEQRKYLITVFHSSNRDNVQAKVSISCKDYFEGLLATVTADFTFGKDTYTCELPAGPNHILITGMGNETNSYLGLNSIVLKPL